MNPTDPLFDRRLVLASALAVLVAPSCTSPIEQRLELAVGERFRQIKAQSTPGLLDTDSDLITTPHILVYQEPRLRLTLPDCAARISMPTALTWGEDNSLEICSASVLGDYVDVAEACQEAARRLAEIQAQGFAYAKDKYSRLANISDFAETAVDVPRTLVNFSDLTPYFLNPTYCVGEVQIFSLRRQGLGVELRMTNMRRSFHDGSNALLRAQEAGMSDAQRRSERAYYLEIGFYDARVRDGTPASLIGPALVR